MMIYWKALSLRDLKSGCRTFLFRVKGHTGSKLERFGAYGPDDRPAAAALPGVEADLKRVFKKNSG
jgi:hypothetical protein